MYTFVSGKYWFRLVRNPNARRQVPLLESPWILKQEYAEKEEEENGPCHGYRGSARRHFRSVARYTLIVTSVDGPAGSSYLRRIVALDEVRPAREG